LSSSAPWSATFCEWLGCVGVGLVPALLAFLTAAVGGQRAYLLSEHFYIYESLLWCNVTIVASVVIFISKYNVVSELSKKTGVPRLPTSMIFLSYIILIPDILFYTFFVIGEIDAASAPWIALICFVCTLLVSFVFERVLASTVHSAVNWRNQT
jgi:hypothetical protein